jgi:hypothetical protein
LILQAIPIDVVGSGFVSRTVFLYADGPGKKVLFPHLKKDARAGLNIDAASGSFRIRSSMT